MIVPSSAGLKFPYYPEWPDPFPFGATATSQVRVPGETVSLTNSYLGYCDYSNPTVQWRKDGQPIGTPEEFSCSLSYPACFSSVLPITNLQADDPAVYDNIVLGNNWFISQPILLSIQPSNGPGVLRTPRIHGDSFVCDLEGVPTRRYAIQISTNFIDWQTALTLTNESGVVTFSNTLASPGQRCYRAALLP